MAKYTAAMAHAAVAKGAAWLDEQCPKWLDEIDLDILDLRHPQVCILGQTADCILGKQPTDITPIEGYWRVVQGSVDPWATEHGFKAPAVLGNSTTYEMLQIAWETLIRARLEAPQ